MTLTMDDKADKSTSVLMLHDEALDPHPFLARELARASSPAAQLS